MSGYRCAIVGCGARGTQQAETLASIAEMELVAVCDLDPRRLEAMREQFGVQALYTDLDLMLAQEQPDILHLMTHPNVRVEPIARAAQAGVKALSVEKPMALRPSEAEAMARIAADSGMKIAVNHQRRYMPYLSELRQVVQEGCIGQVITVRCSSHGTTSLTMPPHAVDLLLMVLGEPEPQEIWATCWGTEGWQSDIMHYAPTETLARVLFPGPLEAYWVHTHRPVGLLGNGSLWMHLDIALWGTAGRAWYTQCEGWGYQSRGMPEPHTGPTAWDPDHVPAQREFTRALARWVEEPPVEHECNLDNSLRGFRLLMGAFKSALTGQPWRAGEPVGDEDLLALQTLMERREGFGDCAPN